MYNNLNQTHWTTKNGEMLNPLTDMKADHIVNVMNLLQDRARKNEEKQMLMLDILSRDEMNKFRNESSQMNIFTLNELKKTPLFRLLAQGLKNAISTGNIEDNPNYEIPRQSSYQDFTKANKYIRGYEPDYYEV